MTWITIDVHGLSINPKSIVQIMLWLSVIGLAGTAAGVVPAADASGWYEIGMLGLLFWAIYDYLIPGLWIMYQQLNEENTRQEPSG